MFVHAFESVCVCVYENEFELKSIVIKGKEEKRRIT